MKHANFLGAMVGTAKELLELAAFDSLGKGLVDGLVKSPVDRSPEPREASFPAVPLWPFRLFASFQLHVGGDTSVATALRLLDK